MLILGIETTCDETSASVVRDGKQILSLQTASSAEVHRLYGGVFPELACRRHIDAIIPVIESALAEARCSPEDLAAIAVSRCPGLIGALLIGVNAAKGLAIAWNKPLLGVNHAEAHLYAAMMEDLPPLPALGFVISGGHTLMLRINRIGSYELLGSTVDDAIGEAFDKTASLLGLPYPGGPALELLATSGSEQAFRFSPGNVKKNPLAFSFSGLKTAVLYALKNATPEDYPGLAASFQKTAFDDLAAKARLALEQSAYRSIVLGGGVSNNLRLRSLFEEQFPHLPLFWPAKGLSLDNGAMIAGLGHHLLLQKPEGDPLDLEALPRMPFWSC